MLNSKIVQFIRRLRLIDGLSLREIACAAGVSVNTVRHYLSDPSGELKDDKKKFRHSKLDKVNQEILQNTFIKANGNCVVVRRYITEIMAKDNPDFSVNESTIYRYIASRYPNLLFPERSPIQQFYVEPGEQLQIDFAWCYVRFLDKDELVKVPIFEAVYSWSRKRYFRICQDLSHTSWLISVCECVARYGMPKIILCDNDRSLVTDHPFNRPAIFNCSFEWICRSLGIRPAACRPYTPKTKGRVERTGRYLKGNAINFINLNGVHSFSELQHLVDDWERNWASQRKITNGTQSYTIEKAFEIESKLLVPLSSWQRQQLQVDGGVFLADSNSNIFLYGTRLTLDYHCKNRRFNVLIKFDGECFVVDLLGKRIGKFLIPAENMRRFKLKDHPLEDLDNRASLDDVTLEQHNSFTPDRGLAAISKLIGMNTK